jgi:hypothetical protein
MCFVLKKIFAVLWEFWRFLGLRGCLEVVMFGLADFALNFCPISEIEPCWSNRINIMWGFYCWVRVANHIKQHVYWYVPKFLVDSLEGLSMRQCGRSWNLEPLLSVVLHITHTKWLVQSWSTLGARTNHGQHGHTRLTTARTWGKPPPSPL